MAEYLRRRTLDSRWRAIYSVQTLWPDVLIILIKYEAAGFLLYLVF